MSIQLRINSQIYQHFKSLTVQRSMVQAAGAMQLSFIGGGEIAPGDKFELLLDEQPAITGFIDSLQLQLANQGRERQAAGRDKAADLADSSAEHTGQLNQLKLDALASALAAPFGIAVSVGAGTDVGEPFESFSIDPGETVWAAIERACRARAVLAISDGLGGLQITRASEQLHPCVLEEGVNVLDARFTLDYSERFHTYTALAQQGEGDATQQWSPTGAVSDTDQAAAQATATDARIRKARQFTQVQDVSAGSNTLADYALWERNVREGNSQRLEIQVQGFSGAGQLWTPNIQVEVRIPSLQISGQWLLESVQHTLGQEGRKTKLSLVPPSAFSLLPEEQSGSASSAKHPWERVDKSQDIIQ